MSEGNERPKIFSSPQEEIAYLRSQIAVREREHEIKNGEADHEDLLTVGKETIREYAEHDPSHILAPNHRMSAHELAGSAAHIETTEEKSHKISEFVSIAETKGVRNALSVLEKLADPYLTDEVHRALIEEIKRGREVADAKEGTPLWSVLHMTLYEVTLPEEKKDERPERALKELISAMEQFYAGMRTVTERSKLREHFTLEVAISNKSDHIVFYAAVPSESANLFEKQVLSLYPNAVLIEQVHDYNIFADGNASAVSVAKLKKHSIYPLKTYDTFDHDTLAVLLNAFSKIERDGSGAALQIALRSGRSTHHETYRGIMRRVREGMKPEKAIALSTITGDLLHSVKDLFKSEDSKKHEKEHQHVDDMALKVFEEKMGSHVIEANVRIVVSAKDAGRAQQILSEIESSFNQFENSLGNKLVFESYKGRSATKAITDYSFREFSEKTVLPLSEKELATLLHFPVHGVSVAPQFKQARAKTAPAPIDIPEVGTHIGINTHRGKETDIYITDKDRLRHFYVIGQTGTGKSVLLKNLVIDDIIAGHGVCYIDPHGTDITDVLSAIPKEREQDVIYFDPAHMERVLGLNMLEYDLKHPEQKTFVVNELFSIFQKLYGAVPESMGPMFEQYFRNATLLVLEDPASGSTLLDISRVMSDEAFRNAKLTKCTNPVVFEFWSSIATKAGGEASLENIVPYITSKFDIFTANDFMRPIIGQQKSAFNFRDIMDSKKILLVNLSKGRLGDINANLIGMIIVGKILMAALSRVDDISQKYPPFYLHIDEFQNITTNSISSILSEARKYKLGLTIAHQFIAQIDEKIRDAVFGNVGSICAFRVGSDDAEFLEKQFAPTFDAHDLMNIENWNAYVRLLANGAPTKPFNIQTLPPHEGDVSVIEKRMHDSYERYGVPRRKIEMDIATRYQH